jgi:hypothetical protein
MMTDFAFWASFLAALVNLFLISVSVILANIKEGIFNVAYVRDLEEEG